MATRAYTFWSAHNQPSWPQVGQEGSGGRRASASSVAGVVSFGSWCVIRYRPFVVGDLGPEGPLSGTFFRGAFVGQGDEVVLDAAGRVLVHG